MRKNSLFKSLVILAITVSQFSCKQKDQDTDYPFVKFDPYDNDISHRVEEYHVFNNPNFANSKTGTPSIFIDFSSGINSALKDKNIKDLISSCYNQLTGNGMISVYKLGGHIVSPALITDRSLPDSFYNPGSYGDIYAPIEAAVDSISRKENDALLITDYEEIQNGNEITEKSFLKKYFVNWLNKGNSIHFFVGPEYREGKITKHIYFTIFNCGNADNNSMLTKLSNALNSLPNYTLSNKTYVLSTKYPNQKSGGIFYDQSGKTEKDKNVLDLKDNYFNGLSKRNYFEFYPFGLDWKFIDKTHATYQSQNQFPHFFSKLFIDLSNEDAYTYSNFDVKVTDATEDFALFAKCNEASQHKPKLAIGTNGESKFDDNEKDPVATTCYDTKGILKEKWKYKPIEVKNLPEVFVLNKELFSNNKNSHKDNVEFAIAFDPKFNIKNIPNPDGLMKVDIIINSATPNLTNPTLDKFKWKNSKGIENKGLYESIKSTLDDVKPLNKSIYTYYIKTNSK